MCGGQTHRRRPPCPAKPSTTTIWVLRPILGCATRAASTRCSAGAGRSGGRCSSRGVRREREHPRDRQHAQGRRRHPRRRPLPSPGGVSSAGTRRWGRHHAARRVVARVPGGLRERGGAAARRTHLRNRDHPQERRNPPATTFGTPIACANAKVVRAGSARARRAAARAKFSRAGGGGRGGRRGRGDGGAHPVARRAGRKKESGRSAGTGPI